MHETIILWVCHVACPCLSLHFSFSINSWTKSTTKPTKYNVCQCVAEASSSTSMLGEPKYALPPRGPDEYYDFDYDNDSSFLTNFDSPKIILSDDENELETWFII